MEYTFIPFFHVRTTRGRPSLRCANPTKDDVSLAMDGANPTKDDVSLAMDGANPSRPRTPVLGLLQLIRAITLPLRVWVVLIKFSNLFESITTIGNQIIIWRKTSFFII